MGFNQRNGSHSVAYNYFKKTLENLNMHCILTGYEKHDHQSVEMIRPREDELSKFYRHFPDGIVMLSGEKSAYFDVKSEMGNYSNYAIEIDSLHAMLQLSKIEKITYIVGVDVSKNSIKLININDVDFETIYLPERFFDRKEELKRLFPGKEIKNIRNTNGSNTPYILLSKNNSKFVTFERFIQDFRFKESLNIKNGQAGLSGWFA